MLTRLERVDHRIVLMARAFRLLTQITLIVTLLLLYIIVWTLPAPTLYSKITLLRQSWHLSEVLKQPPILRAELEKAQQDLGGLRAEVAKAKMDNDELEKKVDIAESATKDLKRKLAQAQIEVAAEKTRRSELQKKLEEEKKRQLDLAEKLKKLKESELPLLNSIPDDDK
eukprot:TRINITY_DN7735_c0_g1_i1.p1 TRINITY_DN7735_c0_g1~~TRINITY_DN7735_c0_g1_i1.p1  ORF type:complete len:170 (+),score=56.22 TRINITY_DN7735_c0_g1_i1:107-616(+)